MPIPNVIVKAPQGDGAGTRTAMPMLREAALTALEAFAPNEAEKHAQALLDVWQAKLKMQTTEYVRRMSTVRQAVGGEAPEMALVTNASGSLYPWFDLFCAGPYQIVGGAGYLPHKIIRADEWAFMLCALWRNPAGINWDPASPSAAGVLSAYHFRIGLPTVNLVSVTAGPVLGPYDFAPIGGGYINSFYALIPPGTLPVPPQGQPHLYEVNMLVDAFGPNEAAASQPFAGFATWIYDPDTQPPTIMSPAPPHWHHDIPVRFLVHS